jgi:hypothetical protein
MAGVGEVAAVIAAVAAVAGATTAVVQGADTARRAQHAQEDAAAQNEILIQQELDRRNQELSAKKLQYRKTIGTLSANASKSGLSISGDTSPAYLLDESKDAYLTDLENITKNSQHNIDAKNYGLGLSNSKLDAMTQNAYSQMAFSGIKGVNALAVSGIWSKSPTTINDPLGPSGSTTQEYLTG